MINLNLGMAHEKRKIEVASFFPETAPKSGHEQKKQEESNWKSLNFQSFFILKKTKINEIHHIRIVV